MKEKERGFTLIELMVVIGIIAILSGALMMGFGRITKSAQRAKAVEAVSAAAQSLAILRQKNSHAWPDVIIANGGADGQGKGMIEDVAKKFAEMAEDNKKVLDVSYKKSGGTITLIGVSRCGVVDPWAEAVLKQPRADKSTKVPSGGVVQDHVIYYAIDRDGDGITEATVGGQSVKVRAEAIAWCAGADGVIAPYANRGRSDDVYSWDKAKEKK
jgi:prepilin-type N-terminal cleavage/methylation domain-containing protein